MSGPKYSEADLKRMEAERELYRIENELKTKLVSLKK